MKMFGWKSSLTIIIEAIEIGIAIQNFEFFIIFFTWLIGFSQCGMMIRFEELEDKLKELPKP